MFSVRQRAKAAPKRIVFSEGEHEKIIRASCHLTRLEDRASGAAGPPGGYYEDG